MVGWGVIIWRIKPGGWMVDDPTKPQEEGQPSPWIIGNPVWWRAERAPRGRDIPHYAFHDPVTASKYYTVPEAEACGLRAGLRQAAISGFTPIRWRGDNMGVIKQVMGEWRTSPKWKSDHLRPIIEENIKLIFALNKMCGLLGQARGGHKG